MKEGGRPYFHGSGEGTGINVKSIRGVRKQGLPFKRARLETYGKARYNLDVESGQGEGVSHWPRKAHQRSTSVKAPFPGKREGRVQGKITDDRPTKGWIIPGRGFRASARG